MVNVRGGWWRILFVLSLAACARRAPPLAGPSNAPVLVTPTRVTLRTAPGDAEWKALGDEATALLSQYVRINTTNPPGNEIAAARWIAEVLRRDGIEARIFEPAPGKANLYARLPGDGSARPLILLNHMDVVLASPEYWTVDPFSGVIKDGYVWGRGTLDMKGEAIAQLMTMLVLKRAHVPLKRDIIFLATADEEIGAGVGAAWISEQRPDLVRDAEFLLTEGGLTRADARGGVEFYGVGTTEKSPFWLDVSARGTAGHGSRPTPDNPVHRLIRALNRIAAWQTPLIVTPPVERSFRDLATIEPDSTVRRWLSDIRTALRDSVAVRAITADLTYNALLRKRQTVAGSGPGGVSRGVDAGSRRQRRDVPAAEPDLAGDGKLNGHRAVPRDYRGRARAPSQRPRHDHDAARIHRQPLLSAPRHRELRGGAVSADAGRLTRRARQRRARQRRGAAVRRAVLLRHRRARRRKIGRQAPPTSGERQT